jgi:hypothetical protein
MIMEWLGWISTVLVLTGFIVNARQLHTTAIIIWIIGDIGWIIYDVMISNMSHLVLSAMIILINMYGIRKIRENKIRK